MSSRENSSYNNMSFYNTSLYKTLEQSGCGERSPSACMSNYGTRSVRDTMDWETFLKSNVGNTKASPGFVRKYKQE
jgi:hypothetical protein